MHRKSAAAAAFNLLSMKSYLTIACVVVSILLAIALFLIKHSDDAQMASDAGTIVDYSNRLDTAQAQIVARDGSLLTLSNRLDESQSAFVAVSNQLMAAQATVAQSAEQVTNLTQQFTAAKTENQALIQRVAGLTNQVTKLAGQLAQTQAGLDGTKQELAQLQKDYARLDNRLRRDVAERVLVERRFDNLTELQAQLKKLQSTPVEWVTSESIYKGLNVEVKSNGVAYVISPE